MTVSFSPTSSFSLSYLGDAYYELWCRTLVLKRVQPPNTVHRQVVELVRCQTQAKIAKLALPFLNDEEKQAFEKGRKMKPLTVPGHATAKQYRWATGFECLVGYWYLRCDSDRFETVMQNEPVMDYILSLFVQPLRSQQSYSLVGT